MEFISWIGAPVNSNYISPVAALLDKLESEYDIIFVVAGTNDRNRTGRLPMGDPADSINSIVVNSVRRNGEPASYTRRGPVLSFSENLMSVTSVGIPMNCFMVVPV